MKKKNNNTLWIIGVLLVLIIIWALFKNGQPDGNLNETPVLTLKPINTLLMLIEFERIEGIMQWEKELDERGLTALVKVQDNILVENPEVFKRLADKGYEIAGGYDEEPFWDMPYEDQHHYLSESKNLVEEITGKKMRVFGSRYFAYDENTLKAADDLGIEYILGRGVTDIETTVYHPEEYEVKIISVSNIDVGEPMGRGSLCDYSLWARGAGALEFKEILDENLAKEPNNMILVSHSYLGGTRLEWWNEYERALSLEQIKWQSFDEWMENLEDIQLSNAEIPVNTEVNYTTPSPVKAMHEYAPIPGLNSGDESEILDDGGMCQ